MTPDPEGRRPSDMNIDLPVWRAAVTEKMLRQEREETCLRIAARLDAALAAPDPEAAAGARARELRNT